MTELHKKSYTLRLAERQFHVEIKRIEGYPNTEVYIFTTVSSEHPLYGHTHSVVTIPDIDLYWQSFQKPRSLKVDVKEADHSFWLGIRFGIRHPPEISEVEKFVDDCIETKLQTWNRNFSTPRFYHHYLHCLIRNQAQVDPLLKEYNQDFDPYWESVELRDDVSQAKKLLTPLELSTLQKKVSELKSNLDKGNLERAKKRDVIRAQHELARSQDPIFLSQERQYVDDNRRSRFVFYSAPYYDL